MIDIDTLHDISYFVSKIGKLEEESAIPGFSKWRHLHDLKKRLNLLIDSAKIAESLPPLSTLITSMIQMAECRPETAASVIIEAYNQN